MDGPLIGEAWVSQASREELQAECHRLSDVALFNLERAWKAEASVQRVRKLVEELKDRQAKAVVSGSYFPADTPQRSRWVGRATGFGVCADMLQRALDDQP